MTPAKKQKPIVYAAHPMTTYGTAIEAFALGRISELVPGATVVNPATRYVDSVHWQTDWPRLLPTLSCLVVFGDEDGSIGTGCLKELANAWWLDIPVAMLDGAGVAHRLAEMTVRPDQMRDPCRTVSLVPGRRVDLALLIARRPARWRRKP
jgi:hypothetical protein